MLAERTVKTVGVVETQGQIVAEELYLLLLLSILHSRLVVSIWLGIVIYVLLVLRWFDIPSIYAVETVWIINTLLLLLLLLLSVQESSVVLLCEVLAQVLWLCVYARQWHISEVNEVFADGYIQRIRSVENSGIDLQSPSLLFVRLVKEFLSRELVDIGQNVSGAARIQEVLVMKDPLLKVGDLPVNNIRTCQIVIVPLVPRDIHLQERRRLRKEEATGSILIDQLEQLEP